MSESEKTRLERIMREYFADPAPEASEGERLPDGIGEGVGKEELPAERRRRAGLFVDLPKGIIGIILDEVAYRNLSIYKLSKISGVARSHIYEILEGKKSPTIHTLCKLFEAVGSKLVIGVRDEKAEVFYSSD